MHRDLNLKALRRPIFLLQQTLKKTHPLFSIYLKDCSIHFTHYKKRGALLVYFYCEFISISF